MARWGWVGVWWVVGCGYPRPYTAAELHADSRDDAGGALVHFLGQTGADVGVCAQGSGVLVRFTADDAEAFVEGLGDGDVAPRVWVRCAAPLMERADGAALAAMTAA